MVTMGEQIRCSNGTHREPMADGLGLPVAVSRCVTDVQVREFTSLTYLPGPRWNEPQYGS